MSKQIDPLRKLKYKASRLEGNNIKQSLLKAGYSPATAHHSSQNGVVKRCEFELSKDFQAKNITVDWVLQELTAELEKTDCKASDRIRVKELLGKYLKMFNDNNIQQTGIFIDTNAEADAKRVIATES